MMNKVMIEGRITKNPVLKESKNGRKYVSFTVANAKPGKNGETYTDFIPCVAWGKTAEIISSYVKKGNLLGIEGMLSVNSTKSEDGTSHKVFITVLTQRVHFLYNGNKQNEEINDSELEMTQDEELDKAIEMTEEDRFQEFMKATDGIFDGYPF